MFRCGLWRLRRTSLTFTSSAAAGRTWPRRPPNKKLDFSEDWFQKAYAAGGVASHRAFFDHWLKGVDNGIMDVPPVRLEIRSGNGASFVLQENEWPVAHEVHSVVSRRDCGGLDRNRGPLSDFLRLSTSEPSVERLRSYSAEVRLLPPGVGAAVSSRPGLA